MDKSKTYNCMNPVFQQTYPPQNGRGDGHTYPPQGEGVTMFQNTNTYETLPTSPQSADGNGRRLEPWPSQKIIVTGINKKTKCCIATSILLVLITGLALGAVAAFAVLTYLDVLRLQARITQLDNVLSSVEPTDDGTVMEDIDYLMQTLMNLELQLNNTDKRYKDQLELVSSNLTKLETLQATVDGINISGQLQDLWLFVREVNSTQNVLSNQLKNISMATDMFITENNAELSDLQSSVNDLTNRLNTSMDLYQGCINETKSCALATNESSSSYREECTTPTLPITRNGLHTIDMRCEYEANIDYMESTGLHRHDDMIRCECDVVWVESDLHTSLHGNLTGTCTLVVTRCPLTITLT